MCEVSALTNALRNVYAVTAGCIVQRIKVDASLVYVNARCMPSRTLTISEEEVLRL